MDALARAESALRPARHGVPARYPWPWTLNVEGRGYHFRTRHAAEAYLAATLGAGITNVDIGCNQVNWRTHAHAFAAPSDALDPVQNARFAAEFLRLLYAETGSWADAIARYHSRNPERAARYRCRIAAVLRPAIRAADCDQ